MKQVTLLFLVKKDNGRVTELCLGMKKRSFGMGKWNGVGGKIEPGETPEAAAIREAEEEIGVKVLTLTKVGVITINYTPDPDWNQQVFTYFAEEWTGTPVETSEMQPVWYKVTEIPYENMWRDDAIWLPRVLAGEKIDAEFTLGDEGKILTHTISKMG